MNIIRNDPDISTTFDQLADGDTFERPRYKDFGIKTGTRTFVKIDAGAGTPNGEVTHCSFACEPEALEVIRVGIRVKELEVQTKLPPAPVRTARDMLASKEYAGTCMAIHAYAEACGGNCCSSTAGSDRTKASHAVAVALLDLVNLNSK